MMKGAYCLTAVLGLCAHLWGVERAIDLSVPAQRDALPRQTRVSSEVGVADGRWADGDWAYRFRITKAWTGELPQWPSVDLPVAVTNWVGYDRLVLDVFNDSIGGDILCCYLSEKSGRIQNGLCPRGLPLGNFAFRRWTIPLKDWPKTVDPSKIGRIHLFFTAPMSADVHVSGFYLLKPGEAVPPLSAAFQKDKVGRATAKAEELAKARRQKSLDDFVAQCRAVGQDGNPAWFGMATSMTKVRPRDAFTAKAAEAFDLRLARGEYESLQLLVLPTDGDLTDVTVEPVGLKRKRTGLTDWLSGRDELPTTAFKVSPMGYVKTVNPPPYKGAENVATNLPGGYFRRRKRLDVGWWPDPILDWLDKADVRKGDVQSFWVRLKCPESQRAGLYEGALRVTGRKNGTAWERSFPLSVRVYSFSVPKKSPLPLAITFGPGPSLQFADREQRALADRLRKDPASPVNAWKKHERAWGDFLADYYITMDSLYHDGNRIHWDVLMRLKEQGRLGRFNLGYWNYPKDLKPETLAAWTADAHRRYDASVAKARELGLIDQAYLYGCDEVSTNFFPNIKWALAKLKELYPDVPRSTTAYDHDFGVGSPLTDMTYFTPTTVKYAENLAKVPLSRQAGHQVWWYIACGPQSPYANLFVEYQAIEARQLMGAQTVKWRPEGFLYYQLTIWNSLRPIAGTETFTDWEPRSWTNFHGDGSWFCCGPDGVPCATIRMENFRDGLEDYAYALEYERVTGRRCEVPPEVCRDIDQFTDDPDVYYAWRNRVAEEIENSRTSLR